MAKIGILNLTARTPPFAYFDEIKFNYYERAGVLFKYIYNEPEYRPMLDYEMLYISDCTHPAGIPAMLEKFLWALTQLLEDPIWKDCDYFIRSNASTFLNIEVLNSIIEELPRKRCYAGYLSFNRFVSGTCIIISRDVARYLVKIKPGKERYRYDDLAIRQYMGRRLMRMTGIPMKFYTENIIVETNTLEKDLSQYPLLRIKNDGDRLIYDYDIWHKISILKGIELKPPTKDII
jgi:hypothetical protein